MSTLSIKLSAPKTLIWAISKCRSFVFIIKSIYSYRFLGSLTLMLFCVVIAFTAPIFIVGTEVLIEWEIISFLSTKIILIFILDYISVIFISVVVLISSAVFIFRTSYISPEPFFSRFLIILSLFVASIGLLIFSPNLISILLGWDGLGVTSYLLVIFYQRRKSYNAGIITALTNRLGDVGLLVCIAIIASSGRWSFIFFSYQSNFFSSIFILILTLSACTKRAQMPFSSWLPAAMAAPTPVSALVHSSTLVTAGVYLLIRFNVLLLDHKRTSLLFLIGAFTIVIAGLAALNELDIKKVIALSTLRQLGVIILTLGIGSAHLSFFHLLSHAYFKAMLFICAGRVIHSIKEYQDIRTIRLSDMGTVKVIAIFILANFRLCGLPFISGFYSKDLILELLLLNDISSISLALIFLGTALTVAYSCRLRFLLIGEGCKGEKVNFIQDRDIFILVGIFLLLPFSLIGGYSLARQLISRPISIYLPVWLKLLIPCAILLGLLVGHLRIYKHYLTGLFFRFFFGKIWFMPLIYSIQGRKVIIYSSKNVIRLSDTIWVNFILNKLAHRFIVRRGEIVFKLNTLNVLRSLALMAFYILILGLG